MSYKSTPTFLYFSTKILEQIVTIFLMIRLTFDVVYK